MYVRKTERELVPEREDGDIERAGQPVCIYEPYLGNGSHALLHNKATLYRGVSMVRHFKVPQNVSCFVIWWYV